MIKGLCISFTYLAEFIHTCVFEYEHPLPRLVKSLVDTNIFHIPETEGSLQKKSSHWDGRRCFLRVERAQVMQISISIPFKGILCSKREVNVHGAVQSQCWCWETLNEMPVWPWVCVLTYRILRQIQTLH